MSHFLYFAEWFFYRLLTTISIEFITSWGGVLPCPVIWIQLLFVCDFRGQSLTSRWRAEIINVMNTGLFIVMLQATVNNSIFSIFSDIRKAKELVLYLSWFSSFIEVDLWLTFDKHHLWSSWAPKLLFLLRCGKSISQGKVLWTALEFENNGSERQSRLQEYAENVLESCLDNIAGSNLSKGMTKASLTWLVTCKNLSAARLCHLGLSQLRCLEDDTLITSLGSL